MPGRLTLSAKHGEKSMTKKELDRLAARFLKGEASREEEAKLHAWYDQVASGDGEIHVPGYEGKEKIHKRLYQTIRHRIENEEPTKQPLKAASIFRWVAAILFLGLAGWFFRTPSQTPKQTHYTQTLPNDVGPGGHIAVLETASGGSVNLDEASIGDTIEAGGIRVCKTAEGIVSLQMQSQNVDDVPAMHMIRTPRGGQYQVVLPDGTRVWLNASSSLRFPSRFDPAMRQVHLNGEAYFEVARALNADQQPVPFHVYSQSQKIEVLGTSFNVSNYQPGKSVTTLVSGSVKVSPLAGGTQALLSPGQELRIANNKTHIATADAESALAWKEGDFIFNDETLGSIIEQLERWYDIEVDCPPDYRGYRFSGAVSRSKNLSSVLKILELTGKVTFELKERRVTIR
jgi:transmembrane sensor